MVLKNSGKWQREVSLDLVLFWLCLLMSWASFHKHDIAIGIYVTIHARNHIKANALPDVVVDCSSERHHGIWDIVKIRGGGSQKIHPVYFYISAMPLSLHSLLYFQPYYQNECPPKFFFPSTSFHKQWNTHTHTDISTFRLNCPRCQLSDKVKRSEN